MIGFLLTLAGSTCLSLAMSRHHRQLFPNTSLSNNRKYILTAAGYALLALAIAACITSMGTALGLTAFVAFLNVAVFSIALLLAFRESKYKKTKR